MPYLNEIVSFVDQAIIDSSLTDKRFEPRQFIGLVQQIPMKSIEGDKLYFLPAKVTTLGEATQIVPDDAFNIQSYHRAVSNTYGIAEAKRQYGDGNSYEVSNTDILLTVIMFTNKLKVDIYQMEAVMAQGFPSALDKDFVQTLQMMQVTVQKLSSRFDSVQLFTEEYRGETKFLKLESLLFQIRYRIEAVYKKGCFTICDPCD